MKYRNKMKISIAIMALAIVLSSCAAQHRIYDKNVMNREEYSRNRITRAGDLTEVNYANWKELLAVYFAEQERTEYNTWEDIWLTIVYENISDKTIYFNLPHPDEYPARLLQVTRASGAEVVRPIVGRPGVRGLRIQTAADDIVLEPGEKYHFGYELKWNEMLGEELDPDQYTVRLFNADVECDSYTFIVKER